MGAMRMEITVSEVTIDQLYEDLGKLREVGFGGHGIEWHTSRSHLGKTITMTLVDAEAGRALPALAKAELSGTPKTEKAPK
jgi:hypothetical protein